MNEPFKRLSMNTILSKARIFDENSSDESNLDHSPTKAIVSEDAMETNSIKIKIEPKEEIEEDTKVSFSLKNVKEEPSNNDEDSVTFPLNVFDQLDLKKEYITPVKLEIEESNTRETRARKSAKRTVFPRDSPYKRDNEFKESPYKTRQSPYKRPEETSDQRTNEKPKRKRKIVELESDPIVLSRRQKQIDYGKNTVAYDIYIQAVPRSKRSTTDPQTPDKYQKYSRRGFDGLIKQWRLKLHKYDPPEDE